MNKKGFTLVELLAVVAILAILVVFAVPNVIKVYNKSLEESFKTQVKATARSAENYAVLNDTSNTFDCSLFEKGDTFGNCSVTKKNSELVIDAVGKGKFENFLMVDYNKKTGEGQFVNLKDLNTIEVGNSVNEYLIIDGNVNSFFHVLSMAEIIDLYKEHDGFNAEELELLTSNFINGSFSSSGIGIFFVSFEITNNGRYNFSFDGSAGEPIMFKNNEEVAFSNLNAELISMSPLEISVDLQPGNYIYGVMFVGNLNNMRIVDTNNSGLNIIGEKNIGIKPSEVSNYIDDGISNNSNKITGENNYFAYTDLTDKVGTYSYNYVVKTSSGIKKFTRNIEVNNYTDESCFTYNSAEKMITNYSNSCSRDVVIPPTINGKSVLRIGTGAFSKCDWGEENCINAINSVILPNALLRIDESAFARNNLTTISIPPSVVEIGYSAFTNNPLTEVIINGSVLSENKNNWPQIPNIGRNAFCPKEWNNNWCAPD